MSVSNRSAASISPPRSRGGAQVRRADVALRMGWAVLAALTLCYVSVIANLTSFPLQDLPNHLARAVVMNDLVFHGGARFGDFFTLRPMPIPYSLGDVVLTVGVELLGTTATGVIWNLLALLSLPAALLFYFRVHRIRADTQVLFLILSLYLTTDWFFVTALSEFRFAVALIVLALALADRLRERADVDPWPAQRGALLSYIVVVVLGYLVHLAMPVFLVPVLGVTGLLRLWSRTTTLRREIMLFVPVAAVLLWHFGTAPWWQYEGDIPVYHYWWGNLYMKVGRLLLHNFQFTRYDLHGTRAFMLCVALYVLWLVRGHLRSSELLRPRVLEMCVLAVAFTGAYFVLPVMYREAAYVDVRALVMISLCLLLACVHVLQPRVAEPVCDTLMQPRDAEPVRATLVHPRGAEPVGDNLLRGVIALPAAALLAAVNLAMIAVPLVRDNAFTQKYREVVAAIPPRAYVLPVYTRPLEGTVMPLLHIGAFVVADRGALIPYLFTGDRGAPVKYFRYTRRLYAPPEWWYLPTYIPTNNVMVSWRPSACQYDFLLVMKPFEPSYIGIPTRTVAENESAALLAVDRRTFACSPAELRR